MSDVRDAVILAAPEDASTRVAGVPLLVRTILILQKAGIERVHVAGPVSTPVDARIRVPVGGAPAPGAAHLVIGAGTVIDQTVVRAAAVAPDPVCWENQGARIERRPAAATGRATSPPAGTLLPASAAPSIVEQTLLRGLENPHDGYLDRLIHRRLSRPLTPFLLRLRLTPNQVTVIGVLIGIVGGVLLGASSVLGVAAGVAALVLSGVLDCSDGEIARITFAESRLGHLLDITGDTLVHLALLTGIALQLGRLGAWPSTTTLVLLGIGVLGSFAAITWSEQSETRRRRVSDAWENRLLDGVMSPLTTRDWYVFPIAFALAGRLDVLVPAAAWGAQVFWIAVLVLVWRVLGRAPG